MFAVHIIFLESVADRISDLMVLLDDDWPRFRERLLAAASDHLNASVIADEIVRATLPTPAATLIRQLMRESSIDAGLGERSRRTRGVKIPPAPVLAHEQQRATAAATVLLQKLQSTSTLGGGTHGEGTFFESGGTGDANPAGAIRPREITVTGHAIDGAQVSQFKEGEIYRLFFRVGGPIAGNLATGDIQVPDVPIGGLATHWVVTSRDVEFVPALSTAQVQKIGNTWIAEFDLLIPETGDSETEEVAVLAGSKPGSLLATVYSVFSDGAREVFREASISLVDQPSVEADEPIKLPAHTHLRTTHEWTTPPEHIQVLIRDSLADISTKRIKLEDYEFREPFVATDTHLSTPIDNVRKALENFREAHGAYLDDLDAADIAAHLAVSGNWQANYFNLNGWQPLPDGSDAKHKAAFDQVQQSKEWRALARAGYALFNICFPQGTQLRALLEKLLPGSRIDFHWSDKSGPGWVSHVPWALMYTEPVGISGQTLPDPEKFLGLRFRIGSRSWSVNNGSVALGDRATTNSMHLLYWGDKPGDDVAVEARWQEGEYSKRKQSRLVPDSALPDLKNQILVALDTPGPSPVCLLYFYCHCSVGNGSETVLRFGNSSKTEDIVEESDLPQSSIPSGPIIFANACTTAQADANRTSALEQSFFQRGVRAFIGTETKVPIKLASKFAWLYFQFFYRVVDQDPMAAGEALTQARMFLWTQYRNVGGLFYSMTNQYDLYLASDKEILDLRRKENT